MDSSGLTENFETGLFEAMDGRKFIACDYNPPEVIWIEVSSEIWRASYGGRLRTLGWSELALPKIIELPIKNILIRRLKKNSPGYLTQIEYALSGFIKAAFSENINLFLGFGEINIRKWRNIWGKLNSHQRCLIRSLYVELAIDEIGGASFLIANEMKTWNSRFEVQVLQNVMHWNTKTGAFVSAEWEVLSQALNHEDAGETDVDCATRIFCRILSETLKRPSQILSMNRDALWTIPPRQVGLPTEYLLRIPKAKSQSGQAPGFWQITEKLGQAIMAYSERPRIREFQNVLDRLVVIPNTGACRPVWMEYGQVDSATAKEHVKNWAIRRRIISPRTQEQIHVTPYRFRHTGGTTLALQGVPRELIQEILEHDSPYSADAYINAVGADLMPVLEQGTDRGIGEVFLALNKAYFFKGLITEDIGKRPVIIPTVSNYLAPAVVGSCGKDGNCNKHPLWACYNGCPHFLAWREANHQQALQYVESELNRWRLAEGRKERSKLEKDFERVGAAIKEVICCIAQEKL